MNMKHIVMLSCLTLASGLAFGQKAVDHDPTYSVNNYKHPNKAAYARKHNLDKSVELPIVASEENRDYKHPGNKKITTTSPAFGTGKTSNTRASYKHPYGL